MQIAKVLIGAAAFFGVAAAHADGFVVTRPISDGREIHLFEHAAECGGSPGALIYRAGKQVEQTCHVTLTASGATVTLPAYGHLFFPRETLNENS